MAKKQSPTTKSAKKGGAKKSSTTARKSSAKASKASKSAGVSHATADKRPTIAEQIDVKQKTEYRGNNWWRWAVWIEAPSTVLNNIEYVEYKLHSTFPDPVQHQTNRKQKFRLDFEGWGEFTINAEIKPKNGAPFTKRHWLTLEYPQPKRAKERPSAKEQKRRGTVFVSAGVSDLRMGNAITKALREQGIRVLKADEFSSGVPWDVALSGVVKDADLMLVLLSGRPTSWAIREIQTAKDHALPILPVVIGPDTVIPDAIEKVQTINLKDAADPDAIAANVAVQVIDRMKVLPEKRKEI